MTTQPLYGGAAQIVFPASITTAFSVVDVSAIRQVPDTQECFIFEHPSKAPAFDLSLIVNLLQQVESSDLSLAMQEHIADMFLDDSAMPQFSIVETKDSSCFAFALHSNDRRDASAEGAPLHVLVFLALIRLEQVSTDVVISMNFFLKDPASVRDVLAQIASDSGDARTDIGANFTTFKEMASSFTVTEWSLFG